MSQSTLATPPPHPIAARLRDAGITSVAIIDDAFDPPKEFDAAEFWGAVRRDNPAKEELDKIAKVVEASDIAPNIVADLWKRRREGTLGPLGPHADEHLFADKLQQIKDVAAIEKNLRDIGLQTLTFGSDQEPPAASRLIFLDYVLDPSATMELDELSTQKATAAYERAEDNSKPFVVLMSDRPDAAEQEETFRAKSHLLGGLFGFISKSDAVSSEKLFLRLGSWGIGNQTNRELQRFVDAVLRAVDDSASVFKERVLALNVQDYAFLQRLTLEGEGKPLGDYMLWLFEASLGHILRDHEGVRQAQDTLDGVRLTSYIPCQAPPSRRLADFYLSAITEPAVKEVATHPHDPQGNVPLLRFGDVFVNSATKCVLMVATSPCDLAFSPNGGRACDPNQPIYLVPGTLQKLDLRDPNSDVRTELVTFNENPYRILWDHTHTSSVLWASISAFLTEKGFERKWRLKLPYALRVQQAFAFHMSRVGLPVAPHFYSPVDVAIYFASADNACVAVGAPIGGGAVVIHEKKGDQFVLTVDCVKELFQRLHQIADHVAEQQNQIPEDTHRANKVKAVVDRSNKIRGMTSNVQMWLKWLETPAELPKPRDKRDLVPGLLCLFREGDMSAAFPRNMHVALNLIPPSSAAVAAEAVKDEQPARTSDVAVAAEPAKDGRPTPK